MSGDEALCERTGVEEVRSKIADNFPFLKLSSLGEAAGFVECFIRHLHASRHVVDFVIGIFVQFGAVDLLTFDQHIVELVDDLPTAFDILPQDRFSR